jgi:hypothetical protein
MKTPLVKSILRVLVEAGVAYGVFFYLANFTVVQSIVLTLVELKANIAYQLASRGRTSVMGTPHSAKS